MILEDTALVSSVSLCIDEIRLLPSAVVGSWLVPQEDVMDSLAHSCQCQRACFWLLASQ